MVLTVRCGTLGGMSNESEPSDWQDTTIDERAAQASPQVAQNVARIEALRQSIDNIDTAVISLLAERFKCTAEVGRLKAASGFAPEDSARETRQAKRQHQVALDAGLDPSIAETYREFVVTEAKKRHQRILDAGGDAGDQDIRA